MSDFALRRAQIELEFATSWHDRAKSRVARMEGAEVGSFSLDEHDAAEHELDQAERALALAQLAVEEAQG
jgi:predicted N-acetyltransferase YhbS